MKLSKDMKAWARAIRGCRTDEMIDKFRDGVLLDDFGDRAEELEAECAKQHRFYLARTTEFQQLRTKNERLRNLAKAMRNAILSAQIRCKELCKMEAEVLE